MATADNRFLSNLAKKLGLDEGTVQKSREYLRVYQNKSSSLHFNITDTAKAVLCLDLASKSTGVAFNKEVALQLSGLKIRVYSTHLNTIEKVLGVDKPLTISEICVQLSCTELKEIAENILEKYKESYPHADVSHPQYIAVAIWSASKAKSIRISKQNIIGISRLKQAQWKDLEQKFDAFLADTKISNTSEKGVKKKEKNLTEYIENYNTNEGSKSGPSKDNGNESKDIEEEYEVWKARILKEAYAKIRKQKS